MLEKGIDETDGVVGLARVEVFGEEFGASGTGGGGENGGIPVGCLVAVFDVKGVLDGLHGERDDVETEPVANEGGGILVRIRQGTGGTGGLNIELLQHLDGQNKLVPLEDFPGDESLFPLGR